MPSAVTRNTGWQRGAFDDARLVLVAFDGHSQKLPGDAAPPGQSVAEILRLIIKVCSIDIQSVTINLCVLHYCYLLQYSRRHSSVRQSRPGEKITTHMSEVHSLRKAGMDMFARPCS